MKLEKKCATCDSNYPDGCPFSKHEKCMENEMEYYKPCTNLEYLQTLTAEEFAEWMMQCHQRYSVLSLVCKDRSWGCFCECKHNQFCEEYENLSGTTSKVEWIKNWLNSPVEVEE